MHFAKWCRIFLPESFCEFSQSILSMKNEKMPVKVKKLVCGTGKSLSEALILGSTNPQYVKRLFIDLQVQYMKTTSSEHGENMFCA